MSVRYLRQCIVVRKDLGQSAGKVAAMSAHAAMTFILERIRPCLPSIDWKKERNLGDQWPRVVTAAIEHLERQDRLNFTADQMRWLTELDPGLDEIGQVSMAKIVLQAADEAHLLAVEEAAKKAGLTVHRVVDSGYSHNPAGTLTCICIGPHWPEQLEPVTGSLKVYR